MTQHYSTTFYAKAGLLLAAGLKLISVTKGQDNRFVFTFEHNDQILSDFDAGRGSVVPLKAVDALMDLKRAMQRTDR